MSRFTRAAALLTTLVAAIVVPSQIALADVPFPPRGARRAITSGNSAPTVVHTVSNAGVSAWAILLIAVAAMLVGVVVAQLAARLRGRAQAHAPATA